MATPVRTGTPILLTATIRPHPDQIGRHGTPESRELQYAAVLRWLARSKFTKVLFCENSGASLANFADINALYARSRKRLELCTYALDPRIAVPGKGWGEGYMIQQALSTSPILRFASSFYKLTGRYKVANLRAVTALVNKATEETIRPLFVCQSFVETARGPYIDTGFFWSDTAFYRQHLLDAYQEVNDAAGVYFEHALGRRIAQLARQFPIAVLPIRAILDGISGYTGLRSLPRGEQLKLHIKNFFSASKLRYVGVQP